MLNALRQARLHRLNLCFDSVDDIECIGAVTDDDNTADGILPAFIQYAPAEFRPN